MEISQYISFAPVLEKLDPVVMKEYEGSKTSSFLFSSKLNAATSRADVQLFVRKEFLKLIK